MKFYIHHLYMLLAVVALIICLCSPLIVFFYQDEPAVELTNFALKRWAEGTSSATSCALGILLIVSALVSAFTMFVSLFKNFALKLTAVSLGAVIYYVVIQAVISLLDIDSNYLKLLSALIVAVFLAVPNLRQKFFKFHRKERSHA